MIQGQYEPSGQQRIRSRLLRQHPVLTPVVLLSGSVALCIASFFADSLFPVLAFIGAPVALFCLSTAFVLGVAGVLATIIGIIERVDRYCLQAAMFPKPKESSYANRN